MGLRHSVATLLTFREFQCNWGGGAANTVLGGWSYTWRGWGAGNTFWRECRLNWDSGEEEGDRDGEGKVPGQRMQGQRPRDECFTLWGKQKEII